MDEIALLTLGGTIAMSGRPVEGVVPRLSGAELTAAVPALKEYALDVRDAHAVPSSNLTFAQLFAVAEEAAQAVKAGAAGVVVTQGTDTLEETAYLFDLIWPHPQPLVLTGAMRNPTLPGADGPANLLAAVQVAASPEARELGALLVFNDEIHAARRVRKTHATSTATFASPDTGPLGHVVEGRVRVLARPPRLPALPATPGEARVALHTVTLDEDAPLLPGLADTYQGLIVAAYGVGHVAAQLAPVLGELATRIPVVLTSRTGGGSVLTATYGSPGSESDLLARGLVNGGFLDPYKARILLRLLLWDGADRARIAEEFARRG
ncbi:asparaginase [Streptomyces indicus]|uniref:L-asparaginase n=1 Tax=Streptomyces indicus TaxID=417292 RepID=A0A1G8YPA4_9ACTN|nr:asparaginase [Streptomyces indicus]SDK04618.1 L-asparaginase [Streptomyces indicus]